MIRLVCVTLLASTWCACKPQLPLLVCIPQIQVHIHTVRPTSFGLVTEDRRQWPKNKNPHKRQQEQKKALTEWPKVCPPL